MNCSTNESKKKTCTKCNKTLLAIEDNFNKSRLGKFGLASQCKPCCVKYRANRREEKYAYDRKRYDENRDEILEKQKEYMSNNKEHKREYDAQYREKNREELLVKKKEDYQQNKERYKESNKAWYAINKESVIEYRGKYYKENKEKVRITSAKWRKNNKELDRISKQRYKARKKNLESSYTVKQWKDCTEHFNHNCAYCGENKPLAQEHFIAVSKGGEYTKNNIIPSCKNCNSSKLGKDFFEWYPKHKSYSKQREQKILKYLNYNQNKEQQLALI